MKAESYKEAQARLEKLHRLLNQAVKNRNEKRYPAGEPGGKGGQYAPKGAGVGTTARVKPSKQDKATGVTRYKFAKDKDGKSMTVPDVPETPTEKKLHESPGFIDLSGTRPSRYTPGYEGQGNYKFVKGKDGEYRLKRTKKDKK